MNRSDFDLSGRMEAASGDTGTAVPSGISGVRNEPASGARSALGNPGRILVRLARKNEADFTAAFDLVRDVHERSIFADTTFLEREARALFDKVVRQPDQHDLLLATFNREEKSVGLRSNVNG